MIQPYLSRVALQHGCRLSLAKQMGEGSTPCGWLKFFNGYIPEKNDILDERMNELNKSISIILFFLYSFVQL